jgi:hypothetical protein
VKIQDVSGLFYKRKRSVEIVGTTYSPPGIHALHQIVEELPLLRTVTVKRETEMAQPGLDEPFIDDIKRRFLLRDEKDLFPE